MHERGARARWSVGAGARVAVVAPSGPSEPEALEAGLAWLRARFDVACDPQSFARAGYLAGDDARRAEALLRALRDPTVRAVLCARGGYGATRVLERAGDELLAAVRAQPKVLVGFSDVTALHALWSRAGAPSLHATMPATVGRGAVDAQSADELLAVLAGAAGPEPWCWRGLAVERWGAGDGAVVEGFVAGGNLALLAALCGTPWAPPLEGAVLFVEDVGERPYRVDRMVTQLRASGALRGVRAVVLGAFVDCGPGPDGVRVEEALREGFAPLGVPLLAGAPFGHGLAQRVLPMGGSVRVERDGAVRFFA